MDQKVVLESGGSKGQQLPVSNTSDDLGVRYWRHSPITTNTQTNTGRSYSTTNEKGSLPLFQP